MTFWTGMANSHICPEQISQSQFVGQIYPSLDKYVLKCFFKFRTIRASLSIESYLSRTEGPYIVMVSALSHPPFPDSYHT